MGTILPSYGDAGVHPDDAGSTSVYRYYDKNDILLYVGITGTGPNRNLQHNQTAEWWTLVARQEVEHHPTRGDALDRERDLIRDHRTPFNVQHNTDHEALRAAYLSFAGASFSVEMSREMLNRLSRTLPLTPVRYEGRLYLRAEPEHYPVSSRIQMRAGETCSGRRGIKATRVLQLGICTLIRIAPKAGSVASGRITLRITCQKPETYGIKSLSLVFNQTKDGRRK